VQAIGVLPSTGMRRVALSIAVLVVTLFGVQAVAQTSKARADSCFWSGSEWLCEWVRPNLAPNTAAFFSAPGGNNLRNWISGRVNDGHGGSVTQKCVHIRRGSDGADFQIACGGGLQGAFVPAFAKPGYLFVRHGAPGARTIIGGGSSP
jgi:hypothetical protein